MKRYHVEGMTCTGCARAVENAIKKQRADASISIDLPTGMVEIGEDIEDRIMQRAVEDAGFEYKGRTT